MAKDKEYMRLMHTGQWLRLRKAVLTAHPICERCEAEGRITPATEVHHICPVEEAITPDEKRRLAYDRHNLRALCHACHVLTHTEMGRSGKDATVKRNERQVDSIVKRFFGEDGGADF